MHIRIALALAAFFTSCGPATAVAAGRQRPSVDPCIAGVHITLEGVLTAHQERGPPGWGDDPTIDSRWTLVELEISRAQAAELRKALPGCFEAADDLSRVQLWSRKAAAFAGYQGKSVHVFGQFKAAGGAPAQTIPGQMDVTDVTAVTPEVRRPTLRQKLNNSHGRDRVPRTFDRSVGAVIP